MTQSKNVVVTGAGRGIGRAVCLRFARDGAQTVAIARTGSELAETKAQVERAGGRCHVVLADLTEESQVAKAIGEAARLGPIHTLVNSAGVAPMARIEELTPAVFDNLWAVNVKALYLSCRAIWPIMKAAGGGTIINISSVSSRDAFAGLAAYGASKAWVNAWTRALAEEGLAFGIRVFAVAPGAVETKMLRDILPDYPRKETLDPTDVAELVHALTQQSFRYSTGQTFFIERRQPVSPK